MGLTDCASTLNLCKFLNDGNDVANLGVEGLLVLEVVGSRNLLASSEALLGKSGVSFGLGFILLFDERHGKDSR